MDNPHAERQNVLLQRIIKNAVRSFYHAVSEIIRANAHVKTAADLVIKYRKNVQYKLKATKPADDDKEESRQA
ncbi:hypothetical protein WOLCODRAFT_81278 [Wolfiporia cocos MD-104 SS10]|uniref:Uncharacterized protein n=1 Tax=Wolfiporia cocos (strain MD-104) TaxID=742152 RepID=A0A2H3J2D7_WOLCO|nr:hypothetical protein WOLCODRAFT_81278 [Wolfiporia cocos MD-104 SS10]